MIDHCSASWSVDEVLSVTGDADNVTVQWCDVTEALHDSIHSKGPHGFGSLLACLLPALFVPSQPLRPQQEPQPPRGERLRRHAMNIDFRNNVIYNWGYFCGYSGGPEESVDMNHVGQLHGQRPGLHHRLRFPRRSGHHPDLTRAETNRPQPNGAFDGADTGWSMFSGTYTQQTAPSISPKPTPPTPPTSPSSACFPRPAPSPGRATRRTAAIAGNVVAGTGSFVNTTAEAGGYPVLTSTPAPADSDNDGMPDDWETAVGSDPYVPNHNADSNGNGYTDIEEYLNWLAAPHAFTQKDSAVQVDLQTQRRPRRTRLCRGQCLQRERHPGTRRSHRHLHAYSRFPRSGQLHLQLYRPR
jgi:hypothetical protein